MNIRKLETKDINKIIFLEENFLGETIGEEMLKSSIDNPYLYFYVITINEEVIGYIGAFLIEGQGEILNFVIDEKYQHQGYGTKLLNIIIEKAKSLNVTSITLEVKVTNIKAISFYQKNNFKVINIRKKYYIDGTDAYLMLKEVV